MRHLLSLAVISVVGIGCFADTDCEYEEVSLPFPPGATRWEFNCEATAILEKDEPFISVLDQGKYDYFLVEFTENKPIEYDDLCVYIQVCQDGSDFVPYAFHFIEEQPPSAMCYAMGEDRFAPQPVCDFPDDYHQRCEMPTQDGSFLRGVHPSPACFSYGGMPWPNDGSGDGGGSTGGVPFYIGVHGRMTYKARSTLPQTRYAVLVSEPNDEGSGLARCELHTDLCGNTDRTARTQARFTVKTRMHAHGLFSGVSYLEQMLADAVGAPRGAISVLETYENKYRDKNAMVDGLDVVVEISAGDDDCAHCAENCEYCPSNNCNADVALQCFVESFRQLKGQQLENMRIVDTTLCDNECTSSDRYDPSSSSDSDATLVVIFSVLGVVLIGAAAFSYYRRRQNPRESYAEDRQSLLHSH